MTCASTSPPTSATPTPCWAVDETGDLKKGACTVGVQRQYTGTAGRIENAQVAVYLTHVGARGHAMIDRELYLPKSWTSDPDRLAAAGVPADIEFLTKPALAAAMLTRALNAGVPARWVAGDEVYGADPMLRAECETRRVGYVLAIGCDRRVPTAAGLLRADEITKDLPRRAWQRLCACAGAKGQRYYDWALINHPDPADAADPTDEPCWWLLVRRHRHTGELAFYRCYSPNLAPLRELVRVAGRRWTVEESRSSAMTASMISCTGTSGSDSGGQDDEVQVVAGGQGEALGRACGDVEDEPVLVPGAVEGGVDVQRASIDLAEQHVGVADEELPGGKAHRRAAGAATTGLHEHHRSAPAGAQAGDRLVRRRRGRDPRPWGWVGHGSLRTVRAAWSCS